MKFIHRLSLLIIVVLIGVPLIIRAQDNGQPQPPPPSDDDIFVPLPPQPPPSDDDIFVPLPPNNNNDDDIFVPLPPNNNNDDDIFVPLPALDTCGNDDPTTIFVPLCPPTTVPKPHKTPTPTTKITNGMWVLDPNGSTYNTSGQCQIEGGDNGGPDGNGDDIEDLPRVPVCMTTDNQWLSVDNGSMYPLVIANYYSQQEMSRELVSTNGKTSGSVNINTTHQYHVVSPTEIQFSYIRNEQGGCTTNSTVTYRLIQADETVCRATVVVTPNYTAVPTQMPTAQPGETQVPPITPEPPIQIGEYTIQLPPVDATCGADKMPPSSKIKVGYDNNQNMSINFGSLSYTLFWNGSDSFDYQEGNQFSISLNTYPGGASLSWSNHGCFVNSQLAGTGLPAVPTTVAGDPTLEPTMDVVAIA
ncbi:MAG: hypothetical protein ABI970_02765, partial [Chloroflexota bacterium]